MTRHSLRLPLVLAAAALPLLAAGFAAAAPSSGGTPSFSTPPRAAKPPVDIGAEMARGRAALEAGDFATAEDAFDKVVDEDRRNAEARAYLGIAQYGLGDYKDARKSLERAVKDDTEMPAAFKTLGLAYLQEEKIEDAEEQLATLEAMRDACAATCADSAAIDESLAVLGDAIAAAEGGGPKALLSPSNGDAAYADAVRLINGARYRDAIDVLLAMDAAAPGNPDVLNYLGFAHRKIGQRAEALAYYKQALAIAPDHVGANEYLGELYVQMGALDLAARQLARLDELCTFACVEYEDLKAVIEAAETAALP